MLENREAAVILDRVVGSDNFSEDPAIISSYTFQPFAGHLAGNLSGKDLFDVIKLGAVVMPGSTEEVQAIVKTCNKYNVTYKAFSTGIGAFALALKGKALQIDLRRMNRILKLDDRNMYAVVEPYVSAIEVVVEAAKKGLTCHIAGAGSQSSILASATSYVGSGHSAVTTSYQGRNYLGSEWILPTGDIVRWGLVEDGKIGHPGPGLIGISRGIFGTMGCLGIFTKAAIKLYPWPGPAQFEITGKNPTPGFKIPSNFKVYLLALPNEEKLGEAVYKLVDAKIAYHLWFLPLFFHAQRWMGDSNDDHYEVWKKLEASGMIDRSLNELTVIIAGQSKKELDYKQKVMKDIIDETGAEQFLQGFLNEHDIERFFCAQMVAHKPCTEFRLGGGDMEQAWSQRQDLATQMKIKRLARQIQKKYVDQHILTNNASESCWGGPEEQRALGHTEYLHFTNPSDIDLHKKQLGFPRECIETAIKEKLLGTGISTSFGETDKIMNKYLGGYFDYKRKIKKIFDPNDVVDSIMYLGYEDK